MEKNIPITGTVLIDGKQHPFTGFANVAGAPDGASAGSNKLVVNDKRWVDPGKVAYQIVKGVMYLKFGYNKADTSKNFRHNKENRNPIVDKIEAFDSTSEGRPVFWLRFDGDWKTKEGREIAGTKYWKVARGGKGELSQKDINFIAAQIDASDDWTIEETNDLFLG